MYKNIRKILVITGVRIGDQLMLTPFFRALQARFSHAKITLATNYPAAEVLENNPHINEIILVNRNIIRKIVRKGKFDMAIDLCGHKDTACLGLIAAARYRMNIDKMQPVRGKTNSFLDNYLAFAKRQGIPPQGRNTEIFLKRAELKKARGIFSRQGLRKDDFVIGIFPSGSRRHILWQPGKFGLLAKNIVRKYNAKILFFYTKDEYADLKKSASALGYAYCLSGNRDIRTVAALMSLCKCVIVSNRGPMHIAAALKVPAIAFFGPYSEKYFFPYEKKGNLIVAREMKCRPCNSGYKMCRHRKCIKSLSVTEAWKKIAPFLDKIYPRIS